MDNHLKIRLSITLGVLAACASCAIAAAKKPNYIVILADDLGYNDIGCFGSPLIKTPNIDRMAREGIRFTSFYVGSPVCSPSRAALLTGCYPVRIGLGDQLCNQMCFEGPETSKVKVIHSGSTIGLNPEETIIPEMLKPAGYVSGMVGKWHLGDAPEFNPVREGFDYFFGVPYSNDMKPFYYIDQTERVAQHPVMDELTSTYTLKATQFIRQNKDKPFFLYLAHSMPHTPLSPGKRFAGKSPRGLYGDAVEEIDWSVGEILNTLEENGLKENTLVIFTSDNGPWLVKGENGGSATPLRNGKTSSYEGGFRVPCVMWGPGIVKSPGSTYDEVVSTMDFLPTFAAMAGIDLKPEKPLDGKNVAAILQSVPNVKAPWDSFLYYFGSELHGVRQGQWKLRAQNTLYNEDIYRKAPGGNTIMTEALYNLDKDVSEQKSVLKAHPKIREKLESSLEQARTKFGDTLTSRTGTDVRSAGHSDHPFDTTK